MYVLQELSAAPTQPWANGGGATTELVSFAASRSLGAGGVEWRLSVAQLERPGAFSALPGVQRTFVPLDGALTLVVEGVAHELEAGTPLQFLGDAEVELTRLDAPGRALNLMVRGARPGRIVAASDSGPVPEGWLVALAEFEGDLAVVTPSITSLTPEPPQVVDASAVRYFVIPA